MLSIDKLPERRESWVNQADTRPVTCSSELGTALVSRALTYSSAAARRRLLPIVFVLGIGEGDPRFHLALDTWWMATGIRTAI